MCYLWCRIYLNPFYAAYKSSPIKLQSHDLEKSTRGEISDMMVKLWVWKSHRLRGSSAVIFYQETLTSLVDRFRAYLFRTRNPWISRWSHYIFLWSSDNRWTLCYYEICRSIIHASAAFWDRITCRICGTNVGGQSVLEDVHAPMGIFLVWVMSSGVLMYGYWSGVVMTYDIVLLSAISFFEISNAHTFLPKKFSR